MTEPTAPTGVPPGALPVTGIEVVSTAPVPEVTAADEIAVLVLAVPGVVQLHPGRFGEVATYLPGRRVAGVRLGDRVVEIHVVLAYDTPVRAVAQQIHAVVAAVVNATVQVFVEDLAADHAA